MSGMCTSKHQIALSRTIIKSEGGLQEFYVASWRGFKPVLKSKATYEVHRNFSERPPYVGKRKGFLDCGFATAEF